jgi:hypothetical protein
MRMDNKLPRPLNEQLGIKLSGWLCEVANKIAESEDIQEKLFSFPDLLEDSSFFDEEEKTLVRFVFSRILSLSFITQKHLEEIKDFYEEYNN